MEKVFNIGFSKTGTTSFEYAMEILDYNVYHGNYKLKHNAYLMALWINGDYDEIKKMTDYWDAFADAPWGGTYLYEKLIEWYPDAKFIYTVRDAEEWYQSIYRMLTKFDPNPNTALDTFHKMGRYEFSYFMKHRFRIENLVNSRDILIDTFKNHKIDTIKFFELKNKPLLIFNPIGNDGWNELCSFLDKPVPDVEYPFRNHHKSKNGRVKTSLKSKLKNKLAMLFK